MLLGSSTLRSPTKSAYFVPKHHYQVIIGTADDTNPASPNMYYTTIIPRVLVYFGN